MRLPFILLSLAALSACATPREQCIAGANRPLATLDRLIAETRGNVNRGFALAEVQDVRVLRTTCEGTNEDGTSFRFPCEETRTFTRQEPVAINVEEERVKLQQLEERRADAGLTARAQIQQCVAVHPE